MFEDPSSSRPSMWASMNSWFTPTMLFVFLNLMIGAIFFRSSLSSPKDQESPQYPKSPSVLQRLKSINLKNYISTKQNSNSLERETSNTHYSSKQTHKNNYNQESDTHYDFNQNHGNKNLEGETHYLERETKNSNTRYTSYGTHKNQKQKTNTLLNPKQAHENKNVERETHYSFQEERETPKATNHYYSSHQTHKTQNQGTNTLFNSTQNHQHQTIERNTRYSFPQNLERETQNTKYPSNQTHKNQNEESHTLSNSKQNHQTKTLERESLNSRYSSHQKHQEKETLERESEHVLEHTQRQQTMNEFYTEVNDSHVGRTKSDVGYFTSKLPPKMIRKSISLKFKEDEEEDVVEARRPATVRERSNRVHDGDDEVDSKADDFINNFRDQLKMQRLKSFVRYNEMINRGS